jgi:CBS-domain-containing membrane protein
MIKFEPIQPVKLVTDQAILPSYKLPEIVHLDDPASSVMHDFNFIPPQTIAATKNIDDALNDMKTKGVPVLLVTHENTNQLKGIIASEDILGEKPIKIMQNNRIDRNKIKVDMVMAPIKTIIAFDMQSVEEARVGNIVTTLKAHSQHYALVIKNEGKQQILRGLFNTSQISRQLHHEITSIQNNNTT